LPGFSTVCPTAWDGRALGQPVVSSAPHAREFPTVLRACPLFAGREKAKLAALPVLLVFDLAAELVPAADPSDQRLELARASGTALFSGVRSALNRGLPHDNRRGAGTDDPVRCVLEELVAKACHLGVESLDVVFGFREAGALRRLGRPVATAHPS
jgi:hypothetical protein